MSVKMFAYMIVIFEKRLTDFFVILDNNQILFCDPVTPYSKLKWRTVVPKSWGALNSLSSL